MLKLLRKLVKRRSRTQQPLRQRKNQKKLSVRVINLREKRLLKIKMKLKRKL